MESKRTKKIIIAVVCVIIAALFLLLLFIPNPIMNNQENKGDIMKKVVGKSIKIDDITEFYWTRSTSTNPPEYQRYRFYTENEKFYFYHEAREGDHYPLTKNDITASGTIELTFDEWNKMYEILSGGTVTKRKESITTGDSGPWTYIYWNGDNSKYQKFTFESAEDESNFIEYCKELKAR